MKEYLTDALVLNIEPQAELDRRISLFTKRFGKLIVKGKSMRKITSKLAGHLSVGNVAQVRLVERNGLQVVDSLKIRKMEAPPKEFAFLHELLHEGEPELELWHTLMQKGFDWQSILKFLGWDPALASCSVCGNTKPEFFSLATQDFLCKKCVESSRNHATALLSINAGT